MIYDEDENYPEYDEDEETYELEEEFCSVCGQQLYDDLDVFHICNNEREFPWDDF